MSEKSCCAAKRENELGSMTSLGKATVNETLLTKVRHDEHLIKLPGESF